ncbi:hypothetical protein HK104_001838 [Borealophlyctis nickersoniae]|nr:hypothetical protein HK104_001838 [Borealophlyctis nickersoniae]
MGDEDGEIPQEAPLVYRSNSAMEKDIDFGWVVRSSSQNQSLSQEGSLGSGGILSTPKSHAYSFDAPSFDTASHVGSLRSITLPEAMDADLLGYQPDQLDPLAGGLDGGFNIGGGEDPIMIQNAEGMEELDLFGDVREDHEGARKRKAVHLGAGDEMNDLANLGAFEFDQFGEGAGAGALAPQGGDGDHAVPGTPPNAAGDAVPGAGDVAVEERKKRRKRRVKVVDNETELSHTEMTNLRAAASAQLDEAERVALVKAKEKKDKEFLKDILVLPALRLGPDLTAFWIATRKRFGDSDLTAPDAKKLKHGGTGGAAPLDDPIEDPLHNAPGFGGDAFIEDPEIFRRGDSSRPSPGVMPWHRRGVSPGSGSTGRDSFTHFPPTDDGFPQFDPWRVSVSNAGSRSVGGRDVSPLGELPDIGLGGDEDMPFKESEIAGVSGGSGIGSSGVERETGSFLNYVTSIAHNAGTDSVQFFDLIPPHATSRAAASQGFYHLLVLATRNVVKPEQAEAFGDIKIVVKGI